MARLQRNYDKPLFTLAIAANIRILVFALASIALMTLDHRFRHLEPVRDALATLVYPLHYAIQVPFDFSRRLYHNLASRQTLLRENQRLQQQQQFMNAQLQKLTVLEAENRRLRALLESSTALRERVLIAELLMVDSDPYRHQIVINKGSYHGVRVAQPLIDQQGVVGQIIHANTLTSRAILITDPNHALPVQVNRNGLRTLALGTGNYAELELPHVPNNEDIRVGDTLLTSGLGGRFPRGYPVAQVTKVEFDPSYPFARISARPTTHLDRIREVLLIIDESPRDTSLAGETARSAR